MKTNDKKNTKRTGQVRAEFVGKEKRGGQVRVQKYGDPAYTASYKVNRSDELMAFLLRKCNTSRNNVKSLLTNRQVLVNGSVVTQYNFMLAKDDEVKLSKKSVQGNIPVAPAAPARGTTRRGGAVKKERARIKIVYEDDDFIAIDKPAGLLSVESDKEAECAFAYVFEYLKAKDKNARPFVLHRIDKETSGVLVFAKDIKIHSMLKMHWNENVRVREYYAVAEGTFEKKADTVVSYLKENVNHLTYSTQDPTGQKAITHYEALKETENYSLLRVRIDTGRKNQIRVHMHELGHPIVGDDKYGHTRDPLKRLGLHASRLEFIHPVTKETVSISATVPQAFRALFSCE
ncbi:MAG: RluA family pseudouridine synthase [Clostridia bacterium]|nr:RluA family pseudouridine synthase [Clostridia bacterium]